jgi:hypothetical protein
MRKPISTTLLALLLTAGPFSAQSHHQAGDGRERLWKEY